MRLFFRVQNGRSIRCRMATNECEGVDVNDCQRVKRVARMAGHPETGVFLYFGSHFFHVHKCP
jgi:hypothetical protein